MRISDIAIVRIRRFAIAIMRMRHPGKKAIICENGGQVTESRVTLTNDSFFHLA